MGAEVITGQSERVERFMTLLDRMMAALDKLEQKHATRSIGNETFLTVTELAKKLKVSERTLQEWRTSGKIDYFQFEKGGKVSFRESDVQQFLEKHLIKAWK